MENKTNQTGCSIRPTANMTMKKLLKIIAIIVLVTAQVTAQDSAHDSAHDIKLNIPKQEFKVNGMQYAGLGLLFIGGVADGYNQVQRHHLYAMLEKHPDLNLDFWGSEQWKNKWELDSKGDLIPYGRPGWAVPTYKEKFWGSSRWFVAVTDAHHLTREIDRLATISGSMMLTIGEKKPFSHYAKLFALGLLARSAGFVLIHDVIYK